MAANDPDATAWIQPAEPRQRNYWCTHKFINPIVLSDGDGLHAGGTPQDEYSRVAPVVKGTRLPERMQAYYYPYYKWAPQRQRSCVLDSLDVETAMVKSAIMARTRIAELPGGNPVRGVPVAVCGVAVDVDRARDYLYANKPESRTTEWHTALHAEYYQRGLFASDGVGLSESEDFMHVFPEIHTGDAPPNSIIHFGGLREDRADLGANYWEEFQRHAAIRRAYKILKDPYWYNLGPVEDLPEETVHAKRRLEAFIEYLLPDGTFDEATGSVDPIPWAFVEGRPVRRLGPSRNSHHRLVFNDAPDPDHHLSRRVPRRVRQRVE